MGTLLDHFQVSATGMKQTVADAKPPLNTLFTYLDAGQPASFEPDQRFLLTSQATLMFSFAPNWAPWTDSADPGSKNSPPCLIQYGTSTDPASGFKLCVTRELDAVVLISPKSAPLILTGSFTKGGMVFLFLNQKTSLSAKAGSRTSGKQETYSFSLGKVSGTPALTLGSLDENAPFAGIIGNVLLFDKDISAAVSANKGPAIDLFEAWEKPNPQSFFDIYSKGSANAAVLSLLGLGFPGEPQPRFDFVPREITRPAGDLPRWMLDNGDTKPIPVRLKGVADSNHAVHTTNSVFCFVRIPAKTLTPNLTLPGGVYLWGDQGHRFVLSYLGNNRFSGVADSTYYGGKWTGQKITLTYTPAPNDAHEPGRMTVECVGWDNSTDQIFAVYICPEGATLPTEIGADVVWPTKIAIKRIPADYRVAADITSDMSEKWSSAFTKSVCNILASMQGWDISKLDNPISIGTSTAAIGTDYKDAIFAPPTADSLNYRAENGSFMPYYCSVTNVDTIFESNDTTAYASVRDLSQKITNSTELGLKVGQGEGGINGSFGSVRKYGVDGSEDHAITINTSVSLSQASVLEKQWLHFNPEFIRALKNANASVPTDLYPVFNKWGTHYANAVIYGTGHYSIAFIDESGAGHLADAAGSSSVSLGIPIEDCFLKLSTSTEKENESKAKETARTEVETAIEIGTHEKLTVMRLDLRPISELTQPPYIKQEDLEWAVTMQPFVQTGLESYLASRPKLVPDGNLLYQAKLLSLENLNDKPSYFNARAFMIGVKNGETDDLMIFFPDTAALNNLKPIWCDSVRLEPRGNPAAIYLAASDSRFSTFGNLSISRGDTSMVPQIRVTGACNVMLEDGIIDVLTYYPDATMGGDGSGGGSPFASAQTPSAQQIRNKEDSLGIVKVDDVGVEWFPWNLGPVFWFGENDQSSRWQREWAEYQIKEKLTFSNLPDNGAIQQTSFDIGGVRATFQVRKVDLIKCFHPAPANFAPPVKTNVKPAKAKAARV